MLRDFGVHSFDDAILTLLPWSEQDEIDSIESIVLFIRSS